MNTAVRCTALTLSIGISFFVGAFGGLAQKATNQIPSRIRDKDPDFAADVGRSVSLDQEFSLMFLVSGRGAVIYIDAVNEHATATVLPYNTLVGTMPLHRWVENTASGEISGTTLKKELTILLKQSIDRYIIIIRDDLGNFSEKLLNASTIEQMILLKQIYESANTDLTLTECIGIASLWEKLQLMEVAFIELEGKEQLYDGELVFVPNGPTSSEIN